MNPKNQLIQEILPQPHLKLLNLSSLVALLHYGSKINDDSFLSPWGLRLDDSKREENMSWS